MLIVCVRRDNSGILVSLKKKSTQKYYVFRSGNMALLRALGFASCSGRSVVFLPTRDSVWDRMTFGIQGIFQRVYKCKGPRRGWWLVFVNSCAQRRNKKEEIRFTDLYLSALYPFLFYLVIGVKLRGQRVEKEEPTTSKRLATICSCGFCTKLITGSKLQNPVP